MRATLTYHSIDDSRSPISVSPKAFAAHLKWLTSGRVRVVSLDEIVTMPDDGQDAVALTFDDGLLNTRQPVEHLLTNGLPVTLFVVSGYVGRTNTWGRGAHSNIPLLPLLDWDHLEELVARGANVAAHTRSHPALTRVSGDALENELEGSIEDLRARLGSKSTHVAYPYGDVDNAVAQSAGRYYRWGHTTEFRSLATFDDSLQLPRLDMYYFNAHGAIEAWGNRGFSRRLGWIRARRSIRARLIRPK